MGFFINLVAKLLGSDSPSHTADTKRELPASVSGLNVTISYSGPTQPAVTISEAEVAEAAGHYHFVLTNEVRLLKTADEWFEEATQKRVATQAPFAVADLETTGLNVDSAEVLELAAVLVEPDGSVTSEFSVLVRTQHPVPTDITRLTGITQAEVAGRSTMRWPLF